MIKHLLSFWVGFMICLLLMYTFSGVDTSIPFSDEYIVSYGNAPSNWVEEEDIYLTGHSVVLNIEGASLSRYAPTGSMKPLFDTGANGIRIIPTTSSQIKVGDIVSFRKGTDLIVHRVVQTGYDERGKYFITKGDNNVATDGKIRFSEIEYVTIGVIW